MSRRVRALVVSAVCFVVAFLLVLVVGTVLGRSDRKVAERDERAMSVEDATGLTQGQRSAVRGFVFFDPQTGTLLCSARETVGGRPACQGTSMPLEGLDTNRLDIVQADEAPGGYDWWTREAVVLQVVKESSALRVLDVLR